METFKSEEEEEACIKIWWRKCCVNGETPRIKTYNILKYWGIGDQCKFCSPTNKIKLQHTERFEIGVGKGLWKWGIPKKNKKKTLWSAGSVTLTHKTSIKLWSKSWCCYYDFEGWCLWPWGLISRSPVVYEAFRSP